jgi:hypothetical protein
MVRALLLLALLVALAGVVVLMFRVPGTSTTDLRRQLADADSVLNSLNLAAAQHIALGDSTFAPIVADTIREYDNTKRKGITS